MEEGKYPVRNSSAIIIASEQPIEMEYEDWLEKFKPIKNLYCDAPFDGLMFETYGKELDHVHRVLENNKQSVWTLVDTDGHSYIIPGYHHVNRLGYFITEVTWDDSRELSVTID